MSLRKLCFFIMLGTIVGFAAIAESDRRFAETDPPKPSIRQLTPALAADGVPWYGDQPTNRISSSDWVRGFRANREMPPAAFLSVQSKNAEDLGAGKVLVASRELGDPIFAKTVILLVHFDAQGVLGLVLNRRTKVPLSRVLADLQAAKDRSDPVYLGGPVEIPAAFALFKSAAKVEGAEHVFGGVYLISGKTLFEQTISTRPDPNVFRVYLGYAGWTRDQLRKEVELGAWLIFPPDASTVFNTDPDSLWSQMIRKTEQKLAANEPTAASPRTRAGQFVEVDYER